MIEVRIVHVGSETELGRIEIENQTEDGLADYADYSVKFGVNRYAAVGMHTRSMLAFPRKKYNVLGLVLQALNTLDPDELEIDGDLEPGRMTRKELGWGPPQR